MSVLLITHVNVKKGKGAITVMGMLEIRILRSIIIYRANYTHQYITIARVS